MATMKRGPWVAAWGLCGLLAGAASAQPVYGWNDYPTQVYHYLKGEETSPQEQLQKLEAGAAKAAAQRAHLPPGYRAHMGLLYLDLGRPDDALAAWAAEKKAFPEAAHYIDYLMNNLRGNGG